jgi:hypothetical protein
MTYVVGCIEMKRLRRSIETDEYHLNFVGSRSRELRFQEFKDEVLRRKFPEQASSASPK